MATTEWKDDFIESYVNVGIEQGAVRTGGAHLIKLLESRKLHPTEQQLARVAECADPEQLDRWFDRALTAATADEVFRD
jgi:hypothetical protein